jgi:molybdopterin-biosynthesis enzyme MoeA-like protein
VVTSGGIGPTHDDVTIKSVAEAFSQRMTMNPAMLQTIVNRLGVESANELQEAQRKMALLPELAVLRFPPQKHEDSGAVAAVTTGVVAPRRTSPVTKDGDVDVLVSLSDETEGLALELNLPSSSTIPSEKTSTAQEWPILQCENVFVLPGVPRFFEEKVDIICEHFLVGRELFKAKVALALEESTFAGYLSDIVVRFPTVAFGSYPYFNSDPRAILSSCSTSLSSASISSSASATTTAAQEYVTMVTLESVESMTDVELALDAIISAAKSTSMGLGVGLGDDRVWVSRD